ncbi:tRNA guanosine(34) transglycosylase Tgt [Patescibacteria group bacterium]|nr:tRNA guanosine(34) transglycosylase Tgt [Patescibacteria group bacterium]
MFKFEITASDKRARVGKLTTPHGVVETPVFLPVGTQASVKSLTPEDLEKIGTQMILANTYHLYLRPGADAVSKMGGLHEFMHWDRPILTDSGGFQVFSLGFGIEHQVGKMIDLFAKDMVLGETIAVDPKELVVRTKLCKIEEDGPTFQSHIDGTVHFFSPEISVETQQKLGSDFIVALDECTSPLHDYEYTQLSMKRSHRWELRSLNHMRSFAKARDGLSQAMFGVIQGGPFEDLRIESAKFVSENDFFGVGVGGALVSKAKMKEILDWIHPHLHPGKPRHLLGIGTVDDIFEGVERGVDIFDCVHPTRIARMGWLLVKNGTVDINKSIYSLDKKSIEEGCNCYTCQNYSRAYLHHLFRARELLAYRLATIHNLYFMDQLMKKIRKAIREKRFAKLKADWLQ